MKTIRRYTNPEEATGAQSRLLRQRINAVLIHEQEPDPEEIQLQVPEHEQMRALGILDDPSDVPPPLPRGGLHGWLKQGDLKAYILAGAAFLAVSAVLAWAAFAVVRPYVNRVTQRASLIAQGDEAADKKDYPAAVAFYDRALAVDPASAEAYCHRGAVRDGMGDHAQAMKDYAEAIRLKPGYYDAYQSRGFSYLATRDFDKALADFNTAIRLEPGLPNAYLGRGSVLFETGKDDLALADFNKSVTLAPRSPAGFASRSRVYLKRKDYGQVVQDLNEALRLDPGNIMALAIRASAYREMKRYPDALADAEDAVRRAPTQAEGYTTRGLIYMETGEDEKALADFQKAEELTPDDSEVVNNLAWIYATSPSEKIRNGQKALALAMQACILTGWENGGIIDTLAAAEAEAGNFKDAEAYQILAIKTSEGAHDTAGLEAMQKRLTGYREEKPYRDEPSLP